MGVDQVHVLTICSSFLFQRNQLDKSFKALRLALPNGKTKIYHSRIRVRMAVFGVVTDWHSPTHLIRSEIVEHDLRPLGKLAVRIRTDSKRGGVGLPDAGT